MGMSYYVACTSCKHFIELYKWRDENDDYNSRFYEFLTDHTLDSGCRISCYTDYRGIPWWDDESQEGLWKQDVRSPRFKQWGFGEDVCVIPHFKLCIPSSIIIYDSKNICAELVYSKLANGEDNLSTFEFLLWFWKLAEKYDESFVVSQGSTLRFNDARFVNYDQQDYGRSE